MNRVELKEGLLSLGMPVGVISVLPKILVASNRTFIEPDGSRSDTFRGRGGIIVSNVKTKDPIKNPNGIILIGVDKEGDRAPDIFVQVKEPSHFESGLIYKDPVQVRIALLTEDGSVVVTNAYPRALTLFSPKVSIYLPPKVQRYSSKYYNQSTDVFDIIFDNKFRPDSEIYLKCQRVSYRTPFEITKLTRLLERDVKRKQIH